MSIPANTAPPLDLLIGLYIKTNEVGVYVRGLRGADEMVVRERLGEHENLLTEKLGVEIGKKYFFMKGKQGNPANPDARKPLIKWLHQEADLYEATVELVFEDRN